MFKGSGTIGYGDIEFWSFASRCNLLSMRFQLLLKTCSNILNEESIS